MGHAAGGEGCVLQSAPDQWGWNGCQTGDHRPSPQTRSTVSSGLPLGIHPDGAGDKQMASRGEPATTTFRITAPAAPSRIELTPGYFQIPQRHILPFMTRRYSLSSGSRKSGLRISGRLKNRSPPSWLGAVLDSCQYQYQTGP
ncbi:hypothetical protein [Escherichia coli]|uniref:hypothetical protein n=1 Tax=Escherichia coli TaxID=562 RepID=UPI00388EA007